MVDSTLLPLAILLLTISTWFTIHHAKKQTSYFVILLSIIAFGLGFATVALLPIDLSYASSTTAAMNNSTDDGSNSEEGADSTSTTSASDTTTTDLSTNNPTYIYTISNNILDNISLSMAHITNNSRNTPLWTFHIQS